MKSYFTPVDHALPPRAGEGHAPRGRPRALVIGSGFGGLAAAVRLNALGYAVEVFEKLDAPGGRAYVWRQDGFTFDAGPTIITAPFMLEELWALCGRRMADDVDLRALDPFYRVRFDDGSWFDYSADLDRMRAEVARFCPADLRGYDRFVAEAATCYRLGFEELGAEVFEGLGSLLRAVPSLVRMRGWRSIHTMVASHFSDPKLRVVMSFHPLLIGGNPFSVTCVYALINTLERRFGVHWAMGGTGALVRGLVGLLRDGGVPVHCNAEVRRIVVEAGRATGIELADGSRHAADIVVSNADTAWTYRHLVEPQHRRHWTDRRIDRGRYSMSLFVWYFGVRGRYESVPHHMMVLGPRYRGLLDDIFRRHHLADDFSLYLHRPSATDPSVAPEGHDAFYALAPVPHLDSGTDWPRFAESYRRAIERRLEDTVLPGLGGRIVSSRVTTPQDFHDRLLAFKGAAFGLEPLLLQSAWFRPHNRSEDIDRLFMVGAGTHPGAGVPGVLMSAKALEKVVPRVHSLA
jgi:phytoene desaturase